ADAPHLRGVPRRLPPRRVPGVRAVTRTILLSLAIASLLAIFALGHRAAASGDDQEDMPIVRRKPRHSLSMPGKKVGAATGVTRCGACHMVEGWEKVRFNHDPTGFP